ncbi:MFS transporter [Halioxenophilus aromaticivorans]|uniref:MFS transporter n=1 Tax=Halioxenophilus aromaticivorans TaxID=1306992 RepID=A0AAV3U7G2_9ALTE
MGTGKTAGSLQGVMLIFPITLTVMGAVLLAPIVPQLMAEFGHVPNANYWVPLLLSLPAICIALGAPVAGWLADRVGRRRLLIMAMAVYGVCGVAPILTNSYWTIFGLRIGVGVCEAIVITCSTTLIGDYFKGDQRDKWLGSQAALASFSAMCLFPVAGFLGQNFGWKGPFALYATSFIFMLGVVLFTWEPDSSLNPEAESSAPKEPLPWKHLLVVCFFTVVGGILFYILQFQMSSALAQFDIQSATTTGLLLSLASIGVPLGAIFYRFAHRKLSTKALLTLEFGILGVGFICMSHAPNYPMFVAAGLINQFGAGMLLPTLLTWAVSPLAHSIRGKGTGIWQSTFAFGQFATTLSFAWVFSMVGQDNILATFQVFGAVAIVVCCISFLLLPKQISYAPLATSGHH